MDVSSSMPFVFGQLADTGEFTNRTKEINRLLTNFSSSLNTTVISPRRWGKSSLVRVVAHKAKKSHKKLRFCFIDMFNIRSEEEFYKAYAAEVIGASSGKIKEWITIAKEYIPSAIPKVTFNTPAGEFEVGLNWKEEKKSRSSILDLPEKLSKAKGIRIVVCIDEFQNIAFLKEPLAFQKALRAHWQHHKNAAYCLYGSKRHMMIELFSSPSMPFYKFGDIIFLEKINEADWSKFIVKRFRDTGKTISKSLAVYLANLVECHSYYVQQLAQLSWLRTKKTCTEDMIADAHDKLALQMSMLFQEKTDNLTRPQVNFVRALFDGVSQFSAFETLKEYDLGSSANVQQVKKALIQKEVIDTIGSRINFLDPLYKYWLMSYYFTRRK